MCMKDKVKNYLKNLLMWSWQGNESYLMMSWKIKWCGKRDGGKISLPIVDSLSGNLKFDAPTTTLLWKANVNK